MIKFSVYLNYWFWHNYGSHIEIKYSSNNKYNYRKKKVLRNLKNAKFEKNNLYKIDRPNKCNMIYFF